MGKRRETDEERANRHRDAISKAREECGPDASAYAVSHAERVAIDESGGLPHIETDPDAPKKSAEPKAPKKTATKKAASAKPADTKS
jgi:hypothetical protein